MTPTNDSTGPWPTGTSRSARTWTASVSCTPRSAQTRIRLPGVYSVDAVAVDQLLNAVASIVEPGDNRTQQQRRADTLVDLLCGRISNGWHPEFDTNSDTDDHLDDDPPHTPPHDQDPPYQDLPDAENHRRNSDDNDRRQGDGTHRGGAEGTDGIAATPPTMPTRPSTSRTTPQQMSPPAVSTSRAASAPTSRPLVSPSRIE